MAKTDAPALDTDVTAKKTRKPQVRKAVELAVVAKVTDEGGNPINDAHIEIVLASKDISGAFKLHKQTPGSDMVTFTMTPGSNTATAEKA